MAYTTIDDPSKYFQTKVYTGTGSSLALTFDGNSDLQPDFVWVKSRTNAYSHYLYDSTRGVQKRLLTDSTAAESTLAQGLTAFGSDGMTFGTDAGANESSDDHVAWGWKANGGTTSSNSTGDITTTVQTDSTSGFSVITYTGNNTDNQTIGHGLGAVPGFAMFKSRAGAVAGTGNWVTHHQSFSGTEYQFMTTAAKSSTNNNFKSSPTNSIFTLGNSDVNESEDIVCYSWTPIQGYSRFGSFVGNGNDDGRCIWTGFKPSLVMIKRVNNSGAWHMYSGGTYGIHAGNEMQTRLEADTADATKSHVYYQLDFLSNGFKFWEEGDNINGGDDTMIYCAWAEFPFVSSDGVPATAV